MPLAHGLCQHALLEVEGAVEAGGVRAHVLLQVGVLVVVDAHGLVAGGLRQVRDLSERRERKGRRGVVSGRSVKCGLERRRLCF